MERQKNETAAAVTEAMRTRLQPYLFAERDTVYACVHSFGCQLNVSDGERIRGMLTELGYTMTDSYEKADLILFNTCAVRESAEDRVYGMLGNIKKYKKTNPNLILVLCGCMASEEHTAEFVRSHYPYVDIVFGTASLSRFPGLLLEHFQGKKFACDTGEYDAMYEGIVPSREHPFKASVPIMFGCNNFCTYCIVPYVRGRERSREKSLILDEARQMISAGYKDITLLGQNVNSYGKTLADKPTFAQLLHEIDSIDGDYWLRFMTSHPKDCSKELIDTIANGTHISKHLHLPFQSGSDRILKAMNRHYDRKKYLDIVNYAKEKIDGVSLTSDIIVGFPGETYEDFKETLSLIREVEFTSLFTFIYSPRVGTPAAKMDDPISAEEKSKWFRELLDVQEEIAAKRCASMVNNTEKVLIESETGKNGELNGRTSGNIIVELKGDKSLIGTFQNVKITQARNWILKGELV